VAKKTPSSEQVRDLLDRFLTTAPQTARSLVAEAARPIVDGLHHPRATREWLLSPAGIAVVGGGLGLFGLGLVLGRRIRVSRRTEFWLAAATSAGVAAGLAIRGAAAVGSAPAPATPDLPGDDNSGA
jgi:hypothetical protein